MSKEDAFKTALAKHLANLDEEKRKDLLEEMRKSLNREKALNEPVECVCGIHRQSCDYHRLPLVNGTT